MRKTHHCTRKSTRTNMLDCCTALVWRPSQKFRPVKQGCNPRQLGEAVALSGVLQCPRREKKHDASSAYYIHSPPLALLLVSVAAAVVAAPSAAVAVAGRVYAPHFHPDPNPEGQTWVYGPARLSSIWVIFSPGPSLQGPSQGDNLGF